jgi:hypothetical protein
MFIRVMYRDGRQDRVRRDQLQELIDTSRITKFKRFSGWVSTVCDPTREKRRLFDPDYEGRERRSDNLTSKEPTGKVVEIVTN